MLTKRRQLSSAGVPMGLRGRSGGVRHAQGLKDAGWHAALFWTQVLQRILHGLQEGQGLFGSLAPVDGGDEEGLACLC